jgi:hypothetical protein
MSIINMNHILENDSAEAAYFKALVQPNAIGTYRRLMEKLTDGLPSWAARGKPGRPKNPAV